MHAPWTHPSRWASQLEDRAFRGSNGLDLEDFSAWHLHRKVSVQLVTPYTLRKAIWSTQPGSWPQSGSDVNNTRNNRKQLKKANSPFHFYTRVNLDKYFYCMLKVLELWAESSPTKSHARVLTPGPKNGPDLEPWSSKVIKLQRNHQKGSPQQDVKRGHRGTYQVTSLFFQEGEGTQRGGCGKMMAKIRGCVHKLMVKHPTNHKKQWWLSRPLPTLPSSSMKEKAKSSCWRYFLWYSVTAAIRN